MIKTTLFDYFIKQAYLVGMELKTQFRLAHQAQRSARQCKCGLSIVVQSK